VLILGNGIFENHVYSGVLNGVVKFYPPPETGGKAKIINNLNFKKR